jgi:hypothetical protein
LKRRDDDRLINLTELESAIVAQYDIAVGSLQYLQRILIGQANEASFQSDQLKLKELAPLSQADLAYLQRAKEEEALVVAELLRELEYVRLSPILEQKSVDVPPLVPRRISIALMREIAASRQENILYYSYFSCQEDFGLEENPDGDFCQAELGGFDDEVFIWVIPFDKRQRIKLVTKQNSGDLKDTIEKAHQNASSFVDRGPQAWASGSRPVRSILRGQDDSTKNAEVKQDELETSLEALYDLLIGPVKDFLVEISNEDNNHLLIIPQQIFFKVPAFFIRIRIRTDRSGPAVWA